MHRWAGLLLRSLVPGVAVLGALAACLGEDVGAAQAVGVEGAACTPSGTCDPGLTCLSARCVRAEADGGAGELEDAGPTQVARDSGTSPEGGFDAASCPPPSYTAATCLFTSCTVGNVCCRSILGEVSCQPPDPISPISTCGLAGRQIACATKCGEGQPCCASFFVGNTPQKPVAGADGCAFTSAPVSESRCVAGGSCAPAEEALCRKDQDCAPGTTCRPVSWKEGFPDGGSLTVTWGICR